MLEPLIINTADMKKMLDAARNEGILEGKREMAEEMLRLGFSISQVATLSKLSFEEISKLEAEEEPDSKEMTLEEEAERMTCNLEFFDYFN